MKEKLTLQQELAKRKTKLPGKFINFGYNFVGTNFVIKKYNPQLKITDNINDCKGPCFLIWNHLSRIDHLYLMKLAYPRPLSIVAGYNEFFRSHLHTVFKLMHIIPKKNFTNDLNGIRGMNSVIRQGGVVCFSPEGMSSIYGHNQPIVPGTGKFIKHYRIPVYCANLRGNYLTSTKMCLDERYGRTEAELFLLFTPEQLDAMTADEIEAKINETFRHDDYEWQKERHIKWKTNGNICAKLNEMCYKCPKCGAELKMSAEKDYIRCNACGNSATMDDYYDFHPEDGSVIPETPSKWVAYERSEIIREIRSNPDYSFSENVKIGYIPTDHLIKNKQTSELCGEGTITFDHTGIHFSGIKLGKPWTFDLSYSVIYSLVITTDTTQFSLYVGDEFYDFFPERKVVGKLLLLTEEMHRLHFNTWKNFPWFDYLYEGMELGIDNKK